MKLIKREQVIVIDDIFTKDEIQWMEDYFTLFDGWQLIFDDPEQSLSQYSLGQVIDLPNFGEFEQFCMRVFKERSGVPVPNFHRVVYNCFRFGDSPNLHIDGEQEDALSFMVYPNTKWSEAWGSESVFVRDGEITDAIIPKPGRLVIFPGSIPHGAKAPNRNHEGVARFSAVFQYTPGQEEEMLQHAEMCRPNTRPFPMSYGE
ncbi:DNA endonuclease V [Synechococcus phage S-SSM4]|uniref:Prolyl 4-hydroxylase alpha subunit Fe(2+) 2OG dioxygenase domain-containing protein n=1 Tax=Synechococcus phage S-SSM4 TaxID=536466 RepID=M1U2I6_9CAUD|nr:DNA endonuclease V [Synechococcus phage S-SSM4]AGG54143.1 hypothetical protein CYXG_00079 [Synechococcus phage S-SSM4]AGG54498.1 hypothetical protein CYWG_00214 [Cyanophage S-SSM6b]